MPARGPPTLDRVTPTGNGTGAGYDLFLSCAGPDRHVVRRLHRALTRAGLRVFLDEHDIGLFDQITSQIELALRSSRALLAYYSASYPSRPACQLELTAAFLAGLREGDPMRRIIVVNPEDPRSGHLLPAELADARYAVLPVDHTDLAALVRRIQDRLGPLTGTFQEIRLTERPRWYGRAPGTVNFVGRYREQWELHSGLFDTDFALTREPTAGPAVSLVGMPGIGKTAVAAVYGWQFGAAYAGGAVYWLSLAGTGGSSGEVLARYAEEVRSIADSVGLRPGDISRSGLFGMVADHLYARSGPSLWVIDDLPDDLDPELVHRLMLPAGTRVRTILITHTEAYRSVARPVRVGPLAKPDAAALLRWFREPQEAEEPAFGRVLERLGGHPFVLTLAGEQLRDRVGLVSFERYADRLADDPDVLSVAADLLRDKIIALGPGPRLVLALAVACAPIPLPAALIGDVVDQFGGPGGGADRAGVALDELRDRLLASRIGATWLFHSLVRGAARRHLQSPVPAGDLAAAAATSLHRLAADPAATPEERGAAIHHAEALIATGDIPTLAEDTLRRRVATYFEDRGEPVLATAHRDRVADRTPSAAADMAAAAATWQAAGDSTVAVRRAGLALALAVRVGDQPTAQRARRTLAEALDALSRYAEADEHWELLLALAAAPGGTDELALRAAYVRGLRLRGRMAEVKKAAGTLLADATVADPAGADPRVQDAAQAAQLELARAEVVTDGQRSARDRAAAVIEHYRRRGLPEHARALEAYEVLAESMLTLHLWELWPDKDNWKRAEGQLRELRDGYRRSHGDTNPLTIAAGVQYAYALVSNGKRDAGRAELVTLLPLAARRLGEGHPLYLRALFLTGLIHAQLQDFQAARVLFDRALAGQRAVLGTRHAHTLRTQYELAIALKMTDDPAWQGLMSEVKQLAPEAVGRVNDLYTQACIALELLRLPAGIVRAITRLTRSGK